MASRYSWVRVRREVEVVDQALEDPQCPREVVGVRPVDGLEVLLGQGAAGTGVLVGAVRAGSEALVLERRADPAEAAVGRQVAEKAAGGPADQFGAHASVLVWEVPARAGRVPMLVLSRWPYTVERGTPNIAAIWATVCLPSS